MAKRKHREELSLIERENKRQKCDNKKSNLFVQLVCMTRNLDCSFFDFLNDDDQTFDCVALTCKDLECYLFPPKTKKRFVENQKYFFEEYTDVDTNNSVFGESKNELFSQLKQNYHLSFLMYKNFFLDTIPRLNVKQETYEILKCENSNLHIFKNTKEFFIESNLILLINNKFIIERTLFFFHKFPNRNTNSNKTKQLEVGDYYILKQSSQNNVFGDLIECLGEFSENYKNLKKKKKIYLFSVDPLINIISSVFENSKYETYVKFLKDFKKKPIQKIVKKLPGKKVEYLTKKDVIPPNKKDKKKRKKQLERVKYYLDKYCAEISKKMKNISQNCKDVPFKVELSIPDFDFSSSVNMINGTKTQKKFSSKLVSSISRKTAKQILVEKCKHGQSISSLRKSLISDKHRSKWVKVNQEIRRSKKNIYDSLYLLKKRVKKPGEESKDIQFGFIRDPIAIQKECFTDENHLLEFLKDQFEYFSIAEEREKELNIY